ncbi:MAG: PmoA family protein [Planctomycetaceae bacterium]|jgi:hypothetical protein|nr:PmoA family protein [Planctomycetaceae bacterium]
MKNIIHILLFLLFLTPLHAESFEFKQLENKVTVLTDNGKPVWQYNGGLVASPDVPTKDARYLAGCYVHPLYGLHGEVLTDNAPKDHYHHHGVFWNWPHVAVTEPDGKVNQFDVWTSNTRMKQLFVKQGELKVEDGKATFTVENGWFIAGKVNEFKFDKDGNPLDEKVMSETVTITTRPVVAETDSGETQLNSRAIDFHFVWTVGAKPITLRGAEGKSYGGLTVRFRPSGKKGIDTLITVPSGVAKDDLPDTPLEWADFTSLFKLDDNNKPTGLQTGATIFVPSTHPDYPPTWLTRYYGPLCIGWPGVKDRLFKPNEKFELDYRIWIHDRKVSLDEIKVHGSSYNLQHLSKKLDAYY